MSEIKVPQESLFKFLLIIYREFKESLLTNMILLKKHYTYSKEEDEKSYVTNDSHKLHFVYTQLLILLFDENNLYSNIIKSKLVSLNCLKKVK